MRTIKNLCALGRVAVVAVGVAGMVAVTGCKRQPEAVRMVEQWLEAEKRGNTALAKSFWNHRVGVHLTAVRDWEILNCFGLDEAPIVLVQIQSSDPVTGVPVIRNYAVISRDGLLQSATLKN